MGSQHADGDGGAMTDRRSDEPKRGTGAGSEAARGIEGDNANRSQEPGTEEEVERSGSEPLKHRETEHKSGYGGEGAEPKISSDQR